MLSTVRFMTSNSSMFDIKDKYTLLQPKVLGPEEIDFLPSQVKEILVTKKQNIVFSLLHIDTIFSSHLTTFVQIYRLLHSFNLQLIITDLSPSVLNVLQMTQLDSLLTLHLTLQDFEDSLTENQNVLLNTKDLEFNYQIESTSEGTVVHCEGYMSFGQNIRILQKELEGHATIKFDIKKVGYMDTRVLIMLADISKKSQLEISGASNVILELFDQHRLASKITFVD